MNKSSFLPFGAVVIAAVLSSPAVRAAGSSSSSSSNSASTDVHFRHGGRTLVASRVEAGGLPPALEMERVTFLGISAQEIPDVLAAQLQLPEGQGLVVSFVQPDSPAAEAGLRKHDVVTRLDDQILIDGRQLSVLVRGREEGDSVTITRLRAGKEAKVTATLVKREMPVARVFELRQGGPGSRVFQTVPYPAGEYDRLFRFEASAVPMAGAIASGVAIFRPKTNVVYTGDDGVSLELLADENGQTLKARDAGGEVIFDGPVTTKEEREALPDDLRARLEKLESMQIERPPAPPAPPMPPSFPARPGTIEFRPEARGEVATREGGGSFRASIPDTPTAFAL